MDGGDVMATAVASWGPLVVFGDTDGEALVALLVETVGAENDMLHLPAQGRRSKLCPALTHLMRTGD